MKLNHKHRVTGRITALLLLTVIVMSLLLSGCKKNDDKYSSASNGYLFTIDDSSYDFGEAKIIFMTYQRMNERVYGEILGEEFWNRQVAEDVSFDVYIKEYCVLPELVCVKALCMMAEEEGIGIPEEAKPYIEAAANQYYYNLSPSEKSYLAVDYDTCYQTFAHYYLAHTMMKYYSKEVDKEISDDAARVAVVKQIYVRDSVNAAKAYEQLTEAMAGFSAVYSEFDESENADASGTVQVSKGSGVYPENYEEAVFALKDGELSQVIETEEGYYIVQCVESFNKELTEENKETIVSRLEYEAWYDDYASFMEGKKTVLNQTAYDAIQFDSVRFEVIDKEQENSLAATEDSSEEASGSWAESSIRVIQTFDISFFDIYDQYISKHETDGFLSK